MERFLMIFLLTACIYVSICFPEPIEMGCYRDSRSTRVLDGAFTSGKSMTRKHCHSYCFRRRSRYYGVEYGEECYCGNSLSAAAMASYWECRDWMCPGDSDLACGGSWRILVFKTLVTNPPNATYMGCYVDPSKKSRLLKGSSKDQPEIMTNDWCKLYCKDQGFLYAGTEYSSECYCSNVRPSYKFWTDSGQCQMACSGDAMEKCGGELRLSLFDISGNHSNAVSGLYEGCFMKSSTGNYADVSKHMTPEYCVGTCYKKRRRYSWVIEGNACHCGDSLELVDRVLDEKCDKKCAGDPAINCGGESHSSVYRTGIPDTREMPKPNYLGCFEDSFERTLNVESLTNQQLDHAFCLEFCFRKGYRFAGMEYGTECYCGDNLLMHRQVAEPECRKPCYGDASQICGGGWRISIFATGIADPTGATGATTTTAAPQPTCPPPLCVPSLSQVSGANLCEGKDIFFQNFTQEFIIDPRKWTPSIFIPDDGFVIFRNHTDNVFVKDGALFIKPTILEEDKVMNGSIRLDGCTKGAGTKYCEREAGPNEPILPPVYSARIHTKDTFSFRYGLLELRAKLPAGDWILPEIRLEPRKKVYGSASIVLGLAVGNQQLTLDETLAGNRMLEQGVSYGDGPEQDKWFVLTESQKEYSKDFHNFTLVWNPDYLMFSVDGQDGKIFSTGQLKDKHPNTPFDQEFYISLGVSVGGSEHFSDESMSGSYEKPWKNNDPMAMAEFFKRRDDWYQTWNGDNAALQVEFIRVTTI